MKGNLIMSEQWYKIIKDEEYCSDVLDIFCGFHDYRITKIHVEEQSSTVLVYFRYDTDEEGAILKFLGVTRLNVCPSRKKENPWLSGAVIRIMGNGDFLWYDTDENYPEEEVFNSEKMNWIAAQEIQFAWLDKSNKIAPLPEEKRNPIWMVMNWDTGKYENIEKHFRVFEA